MLEIKNIKKSFGQTDVLHDVSLSAVSYTHLTLPTKA